MFKFITQNQQILFHFGVVLLHYSCILHFHLGIPSVAAATSKSNFSDQSALLAFKSKLTFDPTNTVLSGNWTTTTSFCNWVGVSCSKRRQRVTALELPFMGLQGTISPHVGNLSFLVSLDLGNNSFIGFIPHEISRLHRLRTLILEANQLTGNIPPALHQCQKLKAMSLAINSLSGVIPKELGFLPSLEELFLGGNKFVPGKIPSSLGNISTLQILALEECGLTGSFPSALLNLSSLVLLSIYGNYNISGILPQDLCYYWPNIEFISFSTNKIAGQLSSRIDQCKEIRVLDLSGNRIVGSIPKEIGSLQNLEKLQLGDNSLTGTIPVTIGNLSNLKVFDVTENNITGSIPTHIFGHLSNLQYLSLAHNNLTGAIPQEIFNISTLQTLTLLYNSLSGTFPSLSTGVLLPNIELLLLSHNEITGNIPSYFSNFTKLRKLDVSYNLLYGPIPMNLGSIKHLQDLNLGGNMLTGEPGIPQLKFLSSLFNSSSLENLFLFQNPLNGIIPDSFGNTSSSLQIFLAESSQIKGNIPKAIGSLKNLTYIRLANNHMSGKIPPAVGGLKRLQRLYLENNNIGGFIPYELCLLRNLGELSLANNRISGLIPNCIGNLTSLQIVLLNSNRLTSLIPMNLLNLENLLFLNLSSNSFSGDLTSIMRKSNVVQMMDLSWNQISGNIPSIIGAFQSLHSLNLSNNLLMGSVPQTLGDLKGLEFLDLSYNNLSGAIPKSLDRLKFLQYLNLSFNQLSGEIPSGGPFVNLTAQSFLENRALCGRPNFGVPPCTTPSKRSKHLLKYILPVVASTMVLIALIYMYLKKYQKGNAGIPSLVDWVTKIDHRIISYQELRRATNDFCQNNLLGVGGFGSVYKGILSDGTTVAVKVLNLQMEGAFKSFDAECKVWRTIRHRNLVKVITACSSPEVRALVLQYMSNGSLEKWLYSHNYCLNLLQRVSMMVDIASALEYLHHGQSEMVVHCDLKPSNILFDVDMVAHVGDFGLAKILAKNKDATQTRTIGTLGYVAPEYGSAGKVSTKGDVYSYGIMLLEIIARKKPTDEMFSGELSLRQWMKASLPYNVLEVVDVGLLSVEEGRDVNDKINIILSILEIGFKCSEEVPEERMDIGEVVPKLKKIKLALENRNRGV